MGSHYFDADPGTSDRRRMIKATIFGRELDFMTSSGTFSPDGLDKATDVLLREIPAPTGEKTLLDLGCGWGPIAVGLALAAPLAEVWAVDVNSRARELTAANASRHRARVRVAAPDAVPGEILFDEIWSNPPVRIGKDELHALLAMWMPRLVPGGVAYLVVGKNLGSDSLQRWLADSGWPAERIASSRGFRVLRVSRG
ncbi:MAG TPA: methyltransferase [Aeromicrobium sp.]|nr:methyltransferase [Aeromicrobium sp.]HKY56572.1 methyltransferase [Aeromicrobium sp.]